MHHQKILIRVCNSLIFLNWLNILSVQVIVNHPNLQVAQDLVADRPDAVALVHVDGNIAGLDLQVCHDLGLGATAVGPGLTTAVLVHVLDRTTLEAGLVLEVILGKDVVTEEVDLEAVDTAIVALITNHDYRLVEIITEVVVATIGTTGMVTEITEVVVDLITIEEDDHVDVLVEEGDIAITEIAGM